MSETSDSRGRFEFKLPSCCVGCGAEARTVVRVFVAAPQGLPYLQGEAQFPACHRCSVKGMALADRDANRLGLAIAGGLASVGVVFAAEQFIDFERGPVLAIVIGITVIAILILVVLSVRRESEEELVRFANWRKIPEARSLAVGWKHGDYGPLIPTKHGLKWANVIPIFRSQQYQRLFDEANEILTPGGMSFGNEMKRAIETGADVSAPFERVAMLVGEFNVGALLHIFIVADWKTRELVVAGLGNIRRDGKPEKDYDPRELEDALQQVIARCESTGGGGTYRTSCIEHATMLLRLMEEQS